MGEEVKRLVVGLRTGQVNVDLFCGQFRKVKFGYILQACLSTSSRLSRTENTNMEDCCGFRL